MIRVLLLPGVVLLFLLVPTGAAQSTADSGAFAHQEPTGPDAVREARLAALRRAIDAGDFERAHLLLGILLFQQRYEEALAAEAAGDDTAALATLRKAFGQRMVTYPAEAVAARERIEKRLQAELLERAEPAALGGDPRTALPLLDEALAIAPRDPRANALRARAALELGEEMGEVFLFQDALASAELAALDHPAVRYFGARAARLLHYADGDPALLDRSMLLARTLLADLHAGRAQRHELPNAPSPEQVHAEAVFDRYRFARQANDQGRASELYDPAKIALQTWLGAAPDDPAAWRGLASLFEWSGEHAEALTVLERALNLLPDDLVIHENLARVARTIGGPAETVRVYEALAERVGSTALVHWFLGQDRLELALDLLDTRAATPADFEAAEASFVRTRELAPEYEEACRGREALCRSGIGWVHYWAGDLEAAEVAFRSMDDVLEGGIEWQYPGRLLSGVDSLQWVADKWYERSLDEEFPGRERDEALARAAEIVLSIAQRRTDDATLANNAGFLCRDASEALERRGSALVENAQGTDEAAIADGLALLERSRALMESSYTSYVRAAELSPDDARVINDTGLILTYYLQRDPDVARAYHERAIAVGVPRIEAGGLEPGDDLFVAVGDAYQNLGYLELCWLGDAAAALPHLEHSMSYAPETRADVPAHLVPLARSVVEGRLDAAVVVAAHVYAPADVDAVLARAAARRTMRAASNE